MLEEVRLFLAVLTGAAASGIPLWFKMRSLSLKLRSDENKVTNKEKINSEAEWKRIIEFRDAEMIRLRERDDQQERQLAELRQQNVNCQKNEAAQAEKIRANEERAKSNAEQIDRLDTKVMKLMELVITQKVIPA